MNPFLSYYIWKGTVMMLPIFVMVLIKSYKASANGIINIIETNLHKNLGRVGVCELSCAMVAFSTLRRAYFVTFPKYKQRTIKLLMFHDKIIIFSS